MASMQSSNHLFDIAKKNYIITLKEEGKGNKYPEEALISIIFAHSYLQGFLNDLVELSGIFESKTMYELRKNWSKQENISLIKKYQLVYNTLKGEDFDENLPPFSHLKNLNSLRNKIIHLKPIRLEPVNGKLEFIIPNVYKTLKTEKIISYSNEEKHTNWFVLIRSSNVAKWACETAINITNSMSNLIPEHEDRKHIINMLNHGMSLS